MTDIADELDALVDTDPLALRDRAISLLAEIADLEGALADAGAEILRLKTAYEERTPTQWAYDQACAALETHRARADQVEELLRIAHQTSNTSERARQAAVQRAEAAEGELERTAKTLEAVADADLRHQFQLGLARAALRDLAAVAPLQRLAIALVRPGDTITPVQLTERAAALGVVTTAVLASNALGNQVRAGALVREKRGLYRRPLDQRGTSFTDRHYDPDLIGRNRRGPA